MPRHSLGATTNRVNSAAAILPGAGWRVQDAVSSTRVNARRRRARPPAFLDLVTFGRIRGFDWCIHPRAAVTRSLAVVRSLRYRLRAAAVLWTSLSNYSHHFRPREMIVSLKCHTEPLVVVPAVVSPPGDRRPHANCRRGGSHPMGSGCSASRPVQRGKCPAVSESNYFAFHGDTYEHRTTRQGLSG